MGAKITRLLKDDGSDSGFVNIVFENGIGISMPASTNTGASESAFENAMHELKTEIKSQKKDKGRTVETWDDVLRDQNVLNDIERKEFIKILKKLPDGP